MLPDGSCGILFDNENKKNLNGFFFCNIRQHFVRTDWFFLSSALPLYWSSGWRRTKLFPKADLEDVQDFQPRQLSYRCSVLFSGWQLFSSIPPSLPLGTGHPFILVVWLFWHQRELVWITKWRNLADNLIRNGSAVWRCLTTANTDDEQLGRAWKMAGAFGVSVYISTSALLCSSCNCILYKLGWSPDPALQYRPDMILVKLISQRCKWYESHQLRQIA